MKILFAVHLNTRDVWPSAYVKLMSNSLAHAMPFQKMFALHVYYDLLGEMTQLQPKLIKWDMFKLLGSWPL